MLNCRWTKCRKLLIRQTKSEKKSKARTSIDAKTKNIIIVLLAFGLMFTVIRVVLQIEDINGKSYIIYREYPLSDYFHTNADSFRNACKSID